MILVTYHRTDRREEEGPVATGTSHSLLSREAGQGAEPECKAGVGLSLPLGSGFCPGPV